MTIHSTQERVVARLYRDDCDMLPANRLYEPVGFSEVYAGYAWRKAW
jgi:hypothetical protein